MTAKKQKINVLEPGFTPGTSENVPLVTFGDFIEWYSSSVDHQSAEMRGAKNMRAMRDDYAKEAVGFVQVARRGEICTVKARVTPEHRVHAPAYKVEVIVEESPDGNSIKSCRCLDCSASSGGCKHGLAVIHWLITRSHEPSVTSVECYWKKSSLSAAVKYGEAIKACNVGPTSGTPVSRSNIDFKETYEQAGITTGTLHMMMHPTPNFLLLQEAVVAFSMDAISDKTCQRFIEFLRSKVTPANYEEAQKGSTQQSSSPLWFELRYGRITASTIYSVAHCHTTDGSLVESILGVRTVPETAAIERGRRLEEKVIRKKFRDYVKCGFFIDPLWPIFGASPDGLTKTHVIEVKCPSKEATVKNYLNGDRLQMKPYGQIQLQMRLANRDKGFFGVASPHFERDGVVTWVEVTRDNEFIEDLMVRARNFWEAAIWPKMFQCAEKL